MARDYSRISITFRSSSSVSYFPKICYELTSSDVLPGLSKFYRSLLSTSGRPVAKSETSPSFQCTESDSPPLSSLSGSRGRLSRNRPF